VFWSGTPANIILLSLCTDDLEFNAEHVSDDYDALRPSTSPDTSEKIDLKTKHDIGSQKIQAPDRLHRFNHTGISFQGKAV